MKTRSKIISISKISFIICFVISLLIVINYEREHVFYSAIKSKVLDITEPALTTASSALYNVSEFFSKTSSIFTVFEDNKNLKKRNEFLEYYFYLYKQSEGENKELRKLLYFSQDIKYNYVSAQIISRSNNSLHQQIIVNAGSNSGIRKGQMVLANNNFIGRVVEVSKNTASILLITDYDSRIPAMGVNSRSKFIAGGQSTQELDCNYLNDKRLQEHELIVTSGDSELIIPGVVIGTAFQKENFFYIKPNIDFSQIEFVQILQVKV